MVKKDKPTGPCKFCIGGRRHLSFPLTGSLAGIHDGGMGIVSDNKYPGEKSEGPGSHTSGSRGLCLSSPSSSSLEASITLPAFPLVAGVLHEVC